MVLFTELNTAVIEEGLLPALPPLTARHTVLLAAVADPRVVEMQHGRGAAELVYGAAAAERAQAERRRLTRCCAAAASRSWTRRRTRSRRPVADAYLSAEGRRPALAAGALGGLDELAVDLR